MKRALLLISFFAVGCGGGPAPTMTPTSPLYPRGPDHRRRTVHAGERPDGPAQSRRPSAGGCRQGPLPGGLSHEVEGRSGFAHLFEHLMFQGSANYDEEYSPLSPIGAAVNGTTSNDRTNYHERVPREVELALWLESDDGTLARLDPREAG